MKAATFSKGASGKVLQIVELATPVPKKDEVLIRVLAASVNALDWRLKSARPGVDVAGEVVAIGRNVTRFKPGDTVFGLGKGAFAEFARARSSNLTHKPDFLTFEQAASLPIGGLTALQSIRNSGRLQSGQQVLINGTAGAVGTFSVQIAKALGGHVTGICSTRNVEQTLALGAESVIDYSREDFTTRADRFDLFIDNVGNRTIAERRKMLTPHGRCIMIGAKERSPQSSATWCRLTLRHSCTGKKSP